MERRVLLAVILSFAVLYAYSTFFAPPPPTPASTAQKPAAATTPAQPGATPTAAPPTAAAAAPAPQAVVGDAAEREIVVETQTVEAVFSNRGGRMLHWRLKEYRDDEGKPVDLIPSAIPADQPTPFSLRVDDPQVNGRINTVIYRTAGDRGGRVDARGSAVTLTFDYQDAAGLQVRKTFTFEPTNYVFKFSASVQDGTRTLNPSIQWGPGLGDIGALSAGGSFFTGNAIQPPQAIFHRANKVERVTRAKVAEQGPQEAQFRFAGVIHCCQNIVTPMRIGVT
jgi:YidC/Oxa1 family membrane protein insertase